MLYQDLRKICLNYNKCYLIFYTCCALCCLSISAARLHYSHQVISGYLISLLTIRYCFERVSHNDYLTPRSASASSSGACTEILVWLFSSNLSNLTFKDLLKALLKNWILISSQTLSALDVNHLNCSCKSSAVLEIRFNFLLADE